MYMCMYKNIFARKQKVDLSLSRQSIFMYYSIITSGRTIGIIYSVFHVDSLLTKVNRVKCLAQGFSTMYAADNQTTVMNAMFVLWTKILPDYYIPYLVCFYYDMHASASDIYVYVIMCRCV